MTSSHRSAVRLTGVLLACGFVLALGGCADRDSLVHRVKNYDANRTAQNQTKTPAPAEKPEQRTDAPDVQQAPGSKPQSGPVQLSQPEGDGVVQSRAPKPVPVDDRLAFLDWFGNSADPAKVKDPVSELRKARAITAGMTPPPETQTPRAGHGLVVSDNSRLVPTYRDGLPNPDGLPRPEGTVPELPQLRGADITGSVTPRKQPGSRKAPDKPEQRHANVDPSAAPSVSPQETPSRDNPIRLHVGLNGGAFDGDDTAVLKDIAVLHLKSGRKIHIHGVSRGPAGNSETSIDRVRRLHKHTNRAIAVLAQFGVKAADISTSTAEQRMTGTYIGTGRPKDRDRLELSLQ